jgi:hypothetical protein
MIHPRQAELVQAAQDRLLRHMHGLDPSTAAVAEMSRIKADGAFGTALEEVLREAVTRFDPTMLVAETLEAMGHSDGPTGYGVADGQP